MKQKSTVKRLVCFGDPNMSDACCQCPDNTECCRVERMQTLKDCPLITVDGLIYCLEDKCPVKAGGLCDYPIIPSYTPRLTRQEKRLIGDKR